MPGLPTPAPWRGAAPQVSGHKLPMPAREGHAERVAPRPAVLVRMLNLAKAMLTVALAEDHCASSQPPAQLVTSRDLSPLIH